MPLLTLFIALIVKFFKRSKEKQIEKDLTIISIQSNRSVDYFKYRFYMIIVQFSIILIFYSFDGIIQSNFAIFTCINIGDNQIHEERVLNDLNLECHSTTNN
eukprot:TRINITY_DN14518_c0_g1_i2.p5 TRINITY_DN14518_c0_g1~~TRINITY_DN14518_c0_g1_i2.p5  ORF type:complete len:102 (+),score=6.87 TRINITY_DN14518_c0_g1_i2:1093-1398(+)